MLSRARTLGLVLIGVGLAVLVSFTAVAVQGVGDFRGAQLAHDRNPGHAMYDLQFFIATTRMGFLLFGAAAGGLLALNGWTLALLGRLAEARETAGGSRDREGLSS
ncbi:MAG: hypothetical protein AB7V27_04880 [Candidatus Binatia bacterium]